MIATTFSTTPKPDSKSDATWSLGRLVRDLTSPKVIFVTDADIGDIDLKKAATLFEAKGILLAVLDSVEGDPEHEVLQAAVAWARANGCKGVCAMSRGSYLDVARVVALLADSTKPFDGAGIADSTQGPSVTLVFVPTTDIADNK